jgi:acetyl esterase
VRLERLGSGAPPLYEMSVEEARAADLAAIRAETAPPTPVARVENLEFEGAAGPLPARLYMPARHRPPVLVYFFGGGWVVGQIDTADPIARSLTSAADIAVFVPGYRLAPEHKFPAAVEDAEAAVRWVAKHAADLGVDGARMAVGGDSAGGNLAAAVTQLLRDAGGPRLVFQLLVYPVTGTSPTLSQREPLTIRSVARRGRAVRREGIFRIADPWSSRFLVSMGACYRWP